MTERRQAFRREPIEVDFGGDRVISIGPVSWLKRNDFGNEVMRQHTQMLNEAVQIFVNEEEIDAAPQISAIFAQKFNDPIVLFELGLDKETYDEVMGIPDLTNDQVVVVLLTICDINGMPQLHPLLDPNSPTPTTLGGMLSNLTPGIDTPKTESGLDSSPQEPTEEPSPISPT